MMSQDVTLKKTYLFLFPRHSHNVAHHSLVQASELRLLAADLYLCS